MKNLFALTALLGCLLPLAVRAQEPAWEIETLSPKNEFIYDLQSGSAVGTNGVLIRYGGAVLTADRVTLDQNSGDAIADGNVRIQRDDQVWVGEHIIYNFKTRMMRSDEFRTGKAPVYAKGENLTGDAAGQNYTANKSIVTTDDYSNPAITIRTRKIRIVSGKYIEAREALLYLGGVPIFYLPYYKRNLGDRANNFNFQPGYRSKFGPYLLGTYSWYWQEELDGALHLDYRFKRGAGAGPDINYHLGRWGDGSLRYYYAYDFDAGHDKLTGERIPDNRHRFYFSHYAEPDTNLTVRAQVRFQGDRAMNRDFFEGEYRNNPHPSTYVEVNKFWDNFSLDAVAQPRINDFLETVERLPDVRLTGYRQQLGTTPFYYQSESSLAYLRRRFAEINNIPTGLGYEAFRGDTYHQILAPYTAFGWLNLTPHVGGRYTFYSDDTGPGSSHKAESRAVLDTGIEASFKVSRLWPTAKNALLDVDGLRHIMTPSANYIYVPKPNRGPGQIPQFDFLQPSLRLRAIDFPAMNSIDSITSENTIRFGVRNTLQTLRNGELATLLDWDLYADARLDPKPGESCLSYLYSDLAFSPRNWITFESEIQYDTDRSVVPLAFHSLTLSPNDRWSWSLGHRYIRNDAFVGLGNNLIASSFYFRLNENWGMQIAHYFEARAGRMEEQVYSLYRDFRAWTSALTLRVRDPLDGKEDFTVAFTFSLKARPRYDLGSDRVRPFMGLVE